MQIKLRFTVYISNWLKKEPHCFWFFKKKWLYLMEPIDHYLNSLKIIGKRKTKNCYTSLVKSPCENFELYFVGWLLNEITGKKGLNLLTSKFTKVKF